MVGKGYKKQLVRNQIFKCCMKKELKGRKMRYTKAGVFHEGDKQRYRKAFKKCATLSFTLTKC